MFSEDYLMRIITQAIAALARVLGLKKAGKYHEALQMIDQALEQLLNLKPDIIKQLEDKSLLQMLTKEGQLDIERLGLIADLFKEEGDIFAAQERFSESRASYIRSLMYTLETGFDEVNQKSSELAGKIEERVHKVGLQNIPDEVCWTLFCYYEQSGAYLQAENTLLEMAERPSTRTEIQPELIAFYERLLEKSPAVLASGEIDPTQVQNKLEQARSR
jgi:hypothetical protein